MTQFYLGKSDDDPGGVNDFELWDKFGGYHGFMAAPIRVVERARLIMAGKAKAQKEADEAAKNKT